MRKKLLTNGNVFKRTDGRWGGVVWYMDEQGERKRKSFSGTTKQEANKKITAYIAEFEKTIEDTDESKKLLKDSLQNWLETVKFPSVEQTSYDRLEGTARCQIYPLLGDKVVGDITPADVKAMLNHWMYLGRSYSLVKKAYVLLNEYYRNLYVEERIHKNPMDNVEMMKKANFLSAQGKEDLPECETIESEDCTPSLSQAVRMKKLSQQGLLDDDKILEIMSEEKANQKERIKIPTEKLRKYFPKNYSTSQIEEAIIDEDTWKRVRELKKHRRRNTVTGRTSLFSGLAYCADCGSKLYFCASKSIDKDAEFFRCSQYKDNRGKCTIHFIRNVVLEEWVLTAIRNVAEYISQFEPVFLYLFAKQHKLSKQHNLKMAKQNLEHSKMRIAEIDRVLTKLYEDNALGKITDERFERLSATYELEQKELYEAISKAEQDIENAEQENVDLKVFLQTIRQCTDLKELAPTIVNTLIKRIDVHNPDEKFKHRRVKIDIYFTAVGLISIPDEKELLALMDEIRNEKSA